MARNILKKRNINANELFEQAKHTIANVAQTEDNGFLKAIELIKAEALLESQMVIMVAKAAAYEMVEEARKKNGSE
jgi:hypothetical protein